MYLQIYIIFLFIFRRKAWWYYCDGRMCNTWRFYVVRCKIGQGQWVWSLGSIMTSLVIKLLVCQCKVPGIIHFHRFIDHLQPHLYHHDFTIWNNCKLLHIHIGIHQHGQWNLHCTTLEALNSLLSEGYIFYLRNLWIGCIPSSDFIIWIVIIKLFSLLKW